MAEAILRKLVAEKLKCKPSEVDGRGVIIASAGVSASAGGPAAAEAVEIMKEKGIDITGHLSQPLTEKLVRQADMLLTDRALADYGHSSFVADLPADFEGMKEGSHFNYYAYY
jgi:protein-tyrosine-phosphatase